MDPEAKKTVKHTVIVLVLLLLAIIGRNLSVSRFAEGRPISGHHQDK